MQKKERKLGRIKVPNRKAKPRQIKKRCVYLSLLMFRVVPPCTCSEDVHRKRR